MGNYMIGHAGISDEARERLSVELASRPDVELIEHDKPIGQIWLASMSEQTAESLRASYPGLIVEPDALLR